MKSSPKESSKKQAASTFISIQKLKFIARLIIFKLGFQQIHSVLNVSNDIYKKMRSLKSSSYPQPHHLSSLDKKYLNDANRDLIAAVDKKISEDPPEFEVKDPSVKKALDFELRKLLYQQKDKTIADLLGRSTDSIKKKGISPLERLIIDCAMAQNDEMTSLVDTTSQKAVELMATTNKKAPPKARLSNTTIV